MDPNATEEQREKGGGGQGATEAGVERIKEGSRQRKREAEPPGGNRGEKRAQLCL